MIRLTILYPKRANSHFDRAYHLDRYCWVILRGAADAGLPGTISWQRDAQKTGRLFKLTWLVTKESAVP